MKTPSQKRLQQIAEKFEEEARDLQAEVLASEIEAIQLVAKDEIVYCPISTFKRRYEGDCIAIQYDENIKNSILLERYYRQLPKGLYFILSRDGLYDYLPKALFYHPTTAISEKEDLVNTRTKEQLEEKSARTFFLPFEQLFYQYRTAVEQDRTNISMGLEESSLFQLRRKFWKIPAEITDESAKAIIAMLPFASEIVANLELTSQCFSYVLKRPVQMHIIPAAPVEIEDHFYLNLGEASLGENFVLTGSFYDGHPMVEITLGGINTEDMVYFNRLKNGNKGNKLGVIEKEYWTGWLPKGILQQWQLIFLLIDFFLPYELSTTIRFEVDQEEKTNQIGINYECPHFLLSTDTCTGRLNFTTSI